MLAGAVTATAAVLRERLVGIAAHRAGPLILAHLACMAGYGGLGVGVLVDRGVNVDSRGLLGIVLIGVGRARLASVAVAIATLLGVAGPILPAGEPALLSGSSGREPAVVVVGWMATLRRCLGP